MDYLVSMTTQVPEGTPDATVDDIRTREAQRSRQLAAQGNLLRLWRPPLQPGEWRTLGLFVAEDGTALEKVLASMPLRMWRRDEVTPLMPHPNDPPAPGRPPPHGGSHEFLVAFTVTVPPGTPADTVDATEEHEVDRVRELADQGHLLRLWALSGQGRALGLWHADDAARMESILESLPLYPWAGVMTTPLTPHPSDPAMAGSR